MSPSEKFGLEPPLQKDAARWATSPYLPRVPTLDEIRAVCDPLKQDHRIPEDPSAELRELRQLAEIRDQPGRIASGEGEPVRKEISRFLQIRPQPPRAVYNMTRPDTEPVIITGRELARWCESEIPGLAHRHAVNILLPDYILSPPAQARICAALEASIYSALLAAWYYKWEDPETGFRARPWEVDNSLSVLYDRFVLPDGSGDGELRTEPQPSPGTPRHPSFPSGHSTYSAAASEILSYFFEKERGEFDKLADNIGMARLWAGIHYRADHGFGAAVGREVAKIVIDNLKRDGTNVDPPQEGKRASLF